jgi:hypothetical protein
MVGDTMPHSDRTACEYPMEVPTSLAATWKTIQDITGGMISECMQSHRTSLLATDDATVYRMLLAPANGTSNTNSCGSVVAYDMAG